MANCGKCVELSVIIKLMEGDLKKISPRRPVEVIIMLIEKISYIFVGVTGFEPATTWSQTRCATGLRYAPSVS